MSIEKNKNVIEERNAKVIFGKNGNGFVSTKITLPVGWVKELGATQDDREVTIRLFEDRIEIIKK